MSEAMIKSSALMALGTLISRVTGFIRNILIVALLGTSLLGDTYNVGNTMPNIIYNLILGGALTAVFLPQIVRAAKDPDGGSLFISKLATLVMSILVALTAVAMIAAPFFLTLYAPSFDGREAQVTLLFIWFCLPQILFYGLYALLGQIANAKGSFGPMMWSPILNNLVVIALFSYFLLTFDEITLGTITDQNVAIIGLGTTLGIAVQALALVPVVKGLKVGIKANFKFRGAGLGKSITLGSWTLLYALITQIGFAITVNLGTRTTKEAATLANDSSLLTSGLGFTPYQNAYLIFLLPHSIFAISIATAILPDLARKVQMSNLEGIRSDLVHSLRLLGVVLVPAMIFFALFGRNLGSAIFFGIPVEDARFIGKLLSAFALAGIPLALNMIFTRSLNAFENTRYQVVANTVINLIAISLSFLAYSILEIQWKTFGMAIAFSISYFIGVFVTYRGLRRFLQHLPHRLYLLLYLKLALISSALFAVAIVLQQLASKMDFVQINQGWGNTLYLVLVLALVTPLYLLIAKRLGVKEVGEVVSLFTRGKVAP